MGYFHSLLVISARGTVGNTALMAQPMAMNQSCYGLRGKHGIGQLYLFHLVNHCVGRLKAHTHGSVFDTVTRQTFESLLVTVPAHQIVARFEACARPLFDAIRRNQQEAITLAAVRDAQLPKLLSGELRVPAVDSPDGGAA